MAKIGKVRVAWWMSQKECMSLNPVALGICAAVYWGGAHRIDRGGCSVWLAARPLVALSAEEYPHFGKSTLGRVDIDGDLQSSSALQMLP